MKWKSLLIVIGKHLLATVTGGIAGIVIANWYGLHVWLPEKISAMSFGVGMLVKALVYIVLSVFFFSIIGMIVGGLIGLVLCLLITLVIKKKRT